jgi:hypothetical protein
VLTQAMIGVVLELDKRSCAVDVKRSSQPSSPGGFCHSSANSGARLSGGGGGQWMEMRVASPAWLAASQNARSSASTRQRSSSCCLCSCASVEGRQ